MFTTREQRRIVNITRMLFKRYGETMTIREVAKERLTDYYNAKAWVGRHNLDKYCEKPARYPIWVVAAQIVKGRKSLCLSANAVGRNFPSQL